MEPSQLLSVQEKMHTYTFLHTIWQCIKQQWSEHYSPEQIAFALQHVREFVREEQKVTATIKTNGYLYQVTQNHIEK